MHEILFSRIALQTIFDHERFQFALGFLSLLAIDIALLLQRTNLSTAFDELQHALIAHEKIDDQKDHQCDDIFRPFANFNLIPEFRKVH